LPEKEKKEYEYMYVFGLILLGILQRSNETKKQNKMKIATTKKQMQKKRKKA